MLNKKLEKEHFLASENMKEEMQEALKKATDEWVQERQVSRPGGKDRRKGAQAEGGLSDGKVFLSRYRLIGRLG